MKNVKAPTSRSYQDYLVSSLQDPQEAVAYLDAILAEEHPEPELLRLALKDVAEALGQVKMTPEQLQHHLEHLDRILPDQQSLTLYSLTDWLNALGLQLTVSVES